MKRIIVIGGMGFLGQHLVKELAGKYPGSAITVLDRIKAPFIDASLNSNPGITAIDGIDVVSTPLGRYLAGGEVVFHLAAMISFWRKDKKALYNVNINGTENVVNACLESGVRRLVYVSSTASLGYNNDKDNPMDETYRFNWKKARGFQYMLSKYYAEQKVKEACGKGLPAVIANPSTMFGPYDKKVFVLIENLLAGKVPAMLPGGYAMTDVRDVARALAIMAEKGKLCENYLIIGGNYTYSEMLSTFARVLGAPVPGKTLPMWLGPLLSHIISDMELLLPSQPKLTREIFAPGFKYRYYSAKKALVQLGWKPEIPLEKTLSDTYEYYKSCMEAK